MSRSCPYRLEISDACSWHQDEALNSSLYILLNTGPTGFLLKEENEAKNFKVFLGDLHTCTCPVFKKEKDLCKHICWLLLKKFRLPRTHPLSWQLGLCEREINDVLRGFNDKEKEREKKSIITKQPDENTIEESEQNGISQRIINDDDVCPICQDEFFPKRLPITYCRFGCGNNVHLKCMKVWADHQKSNNETQLKCPLCREIFNTFEQIDEECRNNSLIKVQKQALHHGLICVNCKASPISGKLYKCCTCKDTYACETCFHTDFHKHHSFLYKENENSKYRKAEQDPINILAPHQKQLLQQGSEKVEKAPVNEQHSLQAYKITEKLIKSWITEIIRAGSKLLKPGSQCRICLRFYKISQTVRRLPRCKHRFHVECIEKWLLDGHPTCPIDGQLAWYPGMDSKEEKRNDKLANEKVEDFNFQVSSIGINLQTKGLAIDKIDIEPNQKLNSEVNKQKTKRKSNLRHNKKVQRTKEPEMFFLAGQNMVAQNAQDRQDSTTSDASQSTTLHTSFNNRLLLPKIVKNQKMLVKANSNPIMNLSRSPFKDPTDMLITTQIKRFDVFNVGMMINKPYQLSRASNISDLSGNLNRNMSDDFEDYVDTKTLSTTTNAETNLNRSNQTLQENYTQNNPRDHDDSDSVSSISTIYNNQHEVDNNRSGQLRIGKYTSTNKTDAEKQKTKLRVHHPRKPKPIVISKKDDKKHLDAFELVAMQIPKLL